MTGPGFLDWEETLELKISSLYRLAAANTDNPLVSAQLKKLSKEKAARARLLRAGGAARKAMSGPLSSMASEMKELRDAAYKAEGFITRCQANVISPLGRMKTLLDFESQLERVHAGAAFKTRERGLRSLFRDLQKDDRARVLLLRTMIEIFRESS